MKLTDYDNPLMTAIISKVEIKPLSEHISPEFHEKFSNLDRDNIIIYFDMEGVNGEKVTRNYFMMIPQLQGYSRSNLSAFRAKNPDLGSDTDEWVGKTILLRSDRAGYPTVAL